MDKKRFSIVTIIVLCTIIFSGANAQSRVGEKESARVFVQKFYDWYIVLWSDEKRPTPHVTVLDIAIKQRPEYFGLALKKAITADDSAQNKTEDDIVGLNFDPFIGQELWGNFEAGDVKQIGERFFVDIRNIEKGSSAKEIQDAELREVVELTRRKGNWVIVNISYPSRNGSEDILQTLKDLKKERGDL
jgi:hypothetical protein